MGFVMLPMLPRLANNAVGMVSVLRGQFQVKIYPFLKMLASCILKLIYFPRCH
jgi:hypothetical protein